jgi:hypothetical protein
MKNYQNNYLSEFEQEFELDSETFEGSNEFESSNDAFEMGAESESDNEFENDFETSENNYLNEFEADNEFENDNEFEQDNEFEASTEGEFEARLYELYSNETDNEFEFENAYNEIMHEMEREYFWGGLKKWAKKGLSAGLKILPINEKYKKMIAGLAKGQLPSLTSLIKTLGPKAAQFIPGIGPILSTAMGAMAGSNAEIGGVNAAKQAAKNTVALAKNTYSNFAEGLLKGVNNGSNMGSLTDLAKKMAQNAVQKGMQQTRLGSKNSNYRRVSRKVSNVIIEGKRYKKVTILYRKIA